MRYYFCEECKSRFMIVDLDDDFLVDNKPYCSHCWSKISLDLSNLRKTKTEIERLTDLSFTILSQPDYKGRRKWNPKCWKGKFRYKQLNMRSKEEAIYASYLDKFKIKFEYEERAFDLGCFTYTPDFYLPETNEYVEIKGYDWQGWSNKMVVKVELLKIIKPEINIRVISSAKIMKMFKGELNVEV